MRVTPLARTDDNTHFVLSVLLDDEWVTSPRSGGSVLWEGGYQVSGSISGHCLADGGYPAEIYLDVLSDMVDGLRRAVRGDWRPMRWA